MKRERPKLEMLCKRCLMRAGEGVGHSRLGSGHGKTLKGLIRRVRDLGAAGGHGGPGGGGTPHSN